MVHDITLARSLAPEDIQVGSHVVVLHRQFQVMMSKCIEGEDPEIMVIPVITRPHSCELPLKVISVCLPFVAVEHPNGKSEMHDTRSVRLARVDASFAKKVLKSHLPKKKKKKKKKKSKCT